MATAKQPHKAKATHTGRKHFRNFTGNPHCLSRNNRSGITKYVARMKKRGTYRTRKGIQKKSY